MTDQMSDEEYADRQLLMNKSLSNIQPAPQIVEYVREFSEDRNFSFGENGEIIDGNIPDNMKLEYWGIDNPNFVWSHFLEWEVKKLECMTISLELVKSQYRVNYVLFNRRRKEALQIQDEKLRNAELYKIAGLQEYAESLCRGVTDKLNQRIHGFAKIRRATGQGRERQMLTTQTTIAQREGDQEKKGKSWNPFKW